MRFSSNGLTLALIAAATAAPASAAIVNIDSLTATGTTVALGAGTYTVTYAGVAGGGAYDAFNYWGEVVGCNGQGTDCDRGWSNHFAIDFGGGTGTGYGLATVGGVREVFDTAGRALSEYSSRTLQSASLAQIGGNANYFMAGGNAYVDVNQPITFTLGAAQNVRFFVIDSFYDDNTGGVSLNVSGVPESSTWALLIAGFGLLGAGLRRRGKHAVASRVRVLHSA